jgi:formate dehydrogenase assembly factor FdhD
MQPYSSVVSTELVSGFSLEEKVLRKIETTQASISLSDAMDGKDVEIRATILKRNLTEKTRDFDAIYDSTVLNSPISSQDEGRSQKQPFFPTTTVSERQEQSFFPTTTGNLNLFA